MTRLSPVRPQFQPALVIPQDRPVYRIMDGSFFGPDDHLYEEGSVIAFEDEPNLAMEPLNDMAEKEMKKFLSKLDDEARKVAEKTGKSFTSYSDSFENARQLAKDESNKIQLIGGGTTTPLMGAKKKNTKISKLEDKPTPALGVSGKLTLNNSFNNGA